MQQGFVANLSNSLRRGCGVGGGGGVKKLKEVAVFRKL